MIGLRTVPFRPNASVNRAQLVTEFVPRGWSPAVNVPAVSLFADVPVNHPALLGLRFLAEPAGISGMTSCPWRPSRVHHMAEFMYCSWFPAQDQGGWCLPGLLAWAASGRYRYRFHLSNAAVTRDKWQAGYLYIYAN